MLDARWRRVRRKVTCPSPYLAPLRAPLVSCSRRDCYPGRREKGRLGRWPFLRCGLPITIAEDMQGDAATVGAAVGRAASYPDERRRALAVAFPIAAVVVVVLIGIYAAVDQYRRPNGGQFLTYLVELAVPIAALVLARGRLARHLQAVALATDLSFTVVLAGRLFLPTTTESGTALFLSLKMLATAVLFRSAVSTAERRTCIRAPHCRGRAGAASVGRRGARGARVRPA